MDTSYKSVVRLFLALVSILTFSSAAFNQQPKLTPPPKTVNPVKLAITVKDERGEFVAGLPRDSFEVSVDKSPAKILSFQSEQTPASIGILFDASRSAGRVGTNATRRNLEVWRDALAGFMAAGNQATEYFLIGFNDRPQLLIDWTSDHKKILNGIVGLQQVGSTAFYDACYLGIDKAQGGRNAKRALLVISDGIDNNSRYSFTELREFVKESEVLLYAVNFPSSREVSSRLSSDGQSVLDELSSISGGTLLYNRGEGPLKLKTVENTFRILASELSSQYLIAIEPVVPASDDNWHKIKVNVNPTSSSLPAKQLTARTRLGYYHR
jgi:Ca-activated chloride channel family protein